MTARPITAQPLVTRSEQPYAQPGATHFVPSSLSLESIYARIQRQAEQRSQAWETLSVDNAVTINMLGRGDRSGIVRSISAEGMTLTGKRGAVVHVIRAKANPGLMTAIVGSMPRGCVVRFLTRIG
jgi:hypothetical protein